MRGTLLLAVGIAMALVSCRTSAPAASEAKTWVEYRCDGLDRPVRAAFDAQAQPPSAVVQVGDEQVVALQVPAASGARYTAKGMEFWEHQGEAMLTWAGQAYSCSAR